MVSARRRLELAPVAKPGGGFLSEQSLSHIPFRLRDELMILSMARWMKFIGVVKVISGMIILFVLLVGLILVGAEMGSSVPALGKAGKLISENKVAFFALGFSTLLLAVAGTWLGFVLCQAADDFERVVRSDEADQDYILHGLIQVKTYFKLSILLGVAAALVGVTAAIALALKLGAIPAT
jgi:hypothetical protein